VDRQWFVAYEESECDNVVVTEKLKDGSITWEENPAELEDRSSLAKVCYISPFIQQTWALGELALRHMYIHSCCIVFSEWHLPGDGGWDPGWVG